MYTRGVVVGVEKRCMRGEEDITGKISCNGKERDAS